MSLFFNAASTPLETLKLGGATLGAMGYGCAFVTGVFNKCIKLATLISETTGIVFQNLTNLGTSAIARSIGFAAVDLAKSTGRFTYVWITHISNVGRWFISIYAVYAYDYFKQKYQNQEALGLLLVSLHRIRRNNHLYVF